MNRTKHRKLKIAVLIAVVVCAVIFALTNFITDYLWFREMGYVSVFFTKLFTMLLFGIPGFFL